MGALQRAPAQIAPRPIRSGLLIVAGVEMNCSPDAQVGGRHHKKVTFTASPTSGAPVVRYRWDFGDGSPIVTTTEPTTTHTYAKRWCFYTVRVEATDELGHRTVTRLSVRTRG